MTNVALIVRDISVIKMDGGQTVALGVLHILYVRFHRQVAGSTELYTLGPLEHQDRAKAGRKSGNNDNAKNHDSPGCRPHQVPAVPKEIVHNQPNANGDNHREKPRPIMVHRVHLEFRYLRPCARREGNERPATQRQHAEETHSQPPPLRLAGPSSSGRRKHAILIVELYNEVKTIFVGRVRLIPPAGHGGVDWLSTPPGLNDSAES